MRQPRQGAAGSRAPVLALCGTHLLASVFFACSLNALYNAARLLEAGAPEAAGVAVSGAVRWGTVGLVIAVAGLIAWAVRVVSGWRGPVTAPAGA